MADKSIIVALIGSAGLIIVAYIQTTPRNTPAAPVVTPTVNPTTIDNGSADNSTSPVANMTSAADPSPTPSSASTDPDALAEDTVEQAHAIRLNNGCAKTVTAWLYYHSNGAWQKPLDKWVLNTGQDLYPLIDGNRLTTDNPNLYLYAESDDHKIIWYGDQNVNYGDTTTGFQKVPVETLENGDYRINLTCD